MGYSKNTAINIDLELSSIDIHDIGLVKPRLSLEVESKLKAIAIEILDKRKPEYYWYILSSHPLALMQLTEYARACSGNQSLTARQEVMYATELTQQQIVHIANGGTIDTIKQGKFKFITRGVFDSKKMYNPLKVLSNYGLLSVIPEDINERHGKKLRVKTTNKGMWVFDYIHNILLDMKNNEIPSKSSVELTSIAAYKASHETDNGVREGPLL